MMQISFAELAEAGTHKSGCVIWTSQDVWSEGHRRPGSYRGTSGRRQRSLRLKQPTPSHTGKGHFWWHITAVVARFTCLAYILLFFYLLYYLVWPNPDLGRCEKVWHRLHSRWREGQYECVLWRRPVVWVQPGYRDRLQKRWNPDSKPLSISLLV